MTPTPRPGLPLLLLLAGHETAWEDAGGSGTPNYDLQQFVAREDSHTASVPLQPVDRLQLGGV